MRRVARPDRMVEYVDRRRRHRRRGAVARAAPDGYTIICRPFRHPCHQRRGLFVAVRSGERLRADLAVAEQSVADRQQQGVAGERPEGVDRLVESQSRQGYHRHRRPRRRRRTSAASISRADRHQVQLRAVSRHRPGDAGSGRRPDRFDVRPGRERAAQCGTATIRALAVTSKRLPSAPEFPTVDEAGLPGFYVASGMAVAAEGHAEGHRDRQAERRGGEALADPAVRKRLVDLGQDIPPRAQQTPEALARSRRPRSRNGGRSSRRPASSRMIKGGRHEGMLAASRPLFGSPSLRRRTIRPADHRGGAVPGRRADRRHHRAILGERMRASLGQPLIVETSPAPRSVGIARVRAPARRLHHRLRGLRHPRTNGAGYSLPYDLVNDFAPVPCSPSNPYLIVAQEGFAAEGPARVPGLLKANPGKVIMGHPGVGTGPISPAIQLARARSAPTCKYIPYRGSARR